MVSFISSSYIPPKYGGIGFENEDWHWLGTIMKAGEISQKR